MYNTNDPRAVRTHKQINHAFIKLMNSKAIESISVTDITKEAQINRSTFYSHYYDKYEILEEVVDQAFIECLKNETLECPPTFSKKTLQALFFSLRAYYINVKDSCKHEHEKVVPFTQKVVLRKSKEYLRPFMNDSYFGKLTIKQKEMWVCTICYSIMGISFEYAENLTDEMINDEIQFLLAIVK